MSRKLISFVDISKVSLIVGCRVLVCCMNFSSDCRVPFHKKSMSSMYLFHRRMCLAYVVMSGVSK